MKTIYIFTSIFALMVLSSCWKEDTPIEFSQAPKIEETNIETTPQAGVSEWIAEEDIVPIYSKFEDIWEGGTDEKILFFSSESCDSCKEADKNLQSEDSFEIFSDIIKIDFDAESSFKERFGVTQAHTFVLIDENENLIKKIEWAMNSKELTKLYE